MSIETSPPVELSLPVSFETRTGDTPSSRRQRQNNPPDFLMTARVTSFAAILMRQTIFRIEICNR